MYVSYFGFLCWFLNESLSGSVVLNDEFEKSVHDVIRINFECCLELRMHGFRVGLEF